jgi:hypothetical protein
MLSAFFALAGRGFCFRSHTGGGNGGLRGCGGFQRHASPLDLSPYRTQIEPWLLSGSFLVALGCVWLLLVAASQPASQPANKPANGGSDGGGGGNSWQRRLRRANQPACLTASEPASLLCSGCVLFASCLIPGCVLLAFGGDWLLLVAVLVALCYLP